MSGDQSRRNVGWATCEGTRGPDRRQGIGRLTRGVAFASEATHVSLRAGAVVALVATVLGAQSAVAASGRVVSSGQGHSCVVTTGGGVKCWGANTYGQLGDGTTTPRTTPVDVSGLIGGVVAVAAGASHTCALTAAGGVRCWGANTYGQVGDGTTTTRATPVDVSGLTTGVVAVAAGALHTCALTVGGGVKCWGWNANAQLGDGTMIDRATPVDVSGLTSGVAAVAPGGFYHTCALTAGGGVKCWGLNLAGQLGDGTTTTRPTPVDVSGLGSGVAAITSGNAWTCALGSTGGVACWGYNGYGQLGDGTTTNRLTPVAVSGLTSGVAGVGAGYSHACAVLGTGALQCWGANSSGQLGDGTTTDRFTPVAVSGLTSGVAVASGGDSHTCALAADGEVRCWGENGSGQLGDGTTTQRLTAAVVTGLAGGEGVGPAGAQKVASGLHHSCAVTAGGGVRCWGYNGHGELGDGTRTNRLTPVDVAGLTSGAGAVAAGASHTCALTTGGGVRCWGDSNYGQRGDGTLASQFTPTDVSGLTSGVLAVAAGLNHSCAVTVGGGVKCWGNNGSGQLGDGTTTNRLTPVDVSGLASGVAAVAAGDGHTCALMVGGGVKCWGENSSGQLGDGSGAQQRTPVNVTGLTSGASMIAVGQAHSCAVLGTGGVKCWGYNYYGGLGDGTTEYRYAPVDVTGLTNRVSAVGLGSGHTCALTTDGGAKCWGYNGYGQVGDGTTAYSLAPVAVKGLTAGATALAAGYYNTCAVTARRGVQCWGRNEQGQLGDGTTTDRTTPVWVTGLVAGVGALDAGTSFACRVTASGGVQCWGANSMGQLGDGTTMERRTPVDVSGLSSGVAAVAVGYCHACALLSTGGVKCWGYNNAGQLGDGTTTDRRTTPVDVIGRTSGTVAITTGPLSTCALTTAGGVQCWGANGYGQLGDGTTTNRSTPAWVSGLTSGAAAVAVGTAHACALTVGGGVKCWGGNGFGQVGDGTTTDRYTPTWVSGLTSGVTAIATGSGSAHTCALTSAGGVKCWGYNSFGELGDGTATDRLVPVDVSGLTSGVAAVAAGAWHTCAVTSAGGVKCWGLNSNGQLGDGTTTMRLTSVDVLGLTSGAATVTAGDFESCAVTAVGGMKCWGWNANAQLGDGTPTDRRTPVSVRGFKLEADYDGDVKADVAVYRPSTGTWFSLDSSAGNASFQSRGWGMEAQGDTPAPGDYDGDGVVDPTVFRPGAGTWFILESSSGFTAYSYVGWGTSGDIPVPADYDGDGKTDVAVYRPSTGTWYIRPSSGATEWSVVFGNATDVPFPGHFDSDGQADIATYRASTGTWFVLTSASGYADWWYHGWGIQAQGDTPAAGDYDGDGRIDLCVFRPATGTWFILESRANYTTWNWFGWGTTGDTLVPNDYDGDAVTDAAVYRASTGTWYVRPSTGVTQWSVVFGQSGDVPLLKIR